jgi:hypothetical protein
MAINYLLESEKYKPEIVKTLLVGEAPPPSGDKYFYVPRAMSTDLPIEEDRSLPATIFYHYFKERPTTTDRYITLLLRLKEKGIFLIDIYNEPIKVRNSPDGVKRIINEIPKLRVKIKSRGINIADRNIVFLLARNTYKTHIRHIFPGSELITWKYFRIGTEIG